jgi:hypothetical protein
LPGLFLWVYRELFEMTWIYRIKLKKMKHVKLFEGFLGTDSSFERVPPIDQETIGYYINSDDTNFLKPLMIGGDSSKIESMIRSASPSGMDVVFLDAPYISPLDFNKPSLEDGETKISMNPAIEYADVVVFKDMNMASGGVIQEIMKLAQKGKKIICTTSSVDDNFGTALRTRFNFWRA